MKVIISRISNRLSVSAFIGENVSDIGISVKSVIGAPLIYIYIYIIYIYIYIYIYNIIVFGIGVSYILPCN